MGVQHHHTLIITNSFYDDAKNPFDPLRVRINEIIDEVVTTHFPGEEGRGENEHYAAFFRTRILYSEDGVNGYATLVIVPDGSKEGWTPSTMGDEIRAAVITYLKETQSKYYWDWVHVGYGELGASLTSDEGEELP